jgi:hypothetical protein
LLLGVVERPLLEGEVAVLAECYLEQLQLVFRVIQLLLVVVELLLLDHRQLLEAEILQVLLDSLPLLAAVVVHLQVVLVHLADRVEADHLHLVQVLLEIHHQQFQDKDMLVVLGEDPSLDQAVVVALVELEMLDLDHRQ